MMKNIHTIILSVAASLLLVPVASAQTDHEKYTLDNGVGGNKYVVNTYPNDDGEYTLRLEAFVTGGVSASAVPTDFVIVMDNSGSMMYDYRKSGITMPLYLSVEQNNAQKLLIKDTKYRGYSKCAYNRIFANGSYNESGTSNLWVDVFFNEATSVGSIDLSRYYFYEDTATPSNTGYYYIYHKTIGGYYNLCIRLKDGSEKYLYETSVHDTPNTTITANNKIIYTGDLWRPLQRREALADAVRAFASQIQKENEKDQWSTTIPAKHQIALVAFGSGYANANHLTPNTAANGYSKLIMDFTEVTDSLAFYNAVGNSMNSSGDTYIDMGVTIARELFEDLQQRNGGIYAPVNADGGTVRNKVAIVLTDGQPSGHTTASGYSGQKGVIKESLEEGVKIKTVTPAEGATGNEINGKIVSIDLYNTDNSRAFLKHLSSNYPNGAQSGTSGNWNTSGYSGSQASTDYYYDASQADLTVIFKGIADANTGQQAGSKLVVMDVMSDSFKLPSNLSGKVKFYTAQCIGTKEIDGETYLAFAQEVEAPARPTLAHLWVSHVEGEGDDAVTVWEDLGASGGVDIDEGITYSTTPDGKSITVKGFDYVTYWCGKDDVIGHNNTRQIDSSDPNYDYQVDGYRGFKLIIEFPIVVSENAIGGPHVLTNNEIRSGVYSADDEGTAIGNPFITYDSPTLLIPVRLDIRKSGLKPGESASFILQRREIADGSEWEDYTSFILIGTEGTTLPSVQMFTMDPAYYYRVKENGWSWNYTNPAQVETTYPSTETLTLNPIVIENTYADKDVKHAEAQAVNTMKSGSSGSTTVYDVN